MVNKIELWNTDIEINQNSISNLDAVQESQVKNIENIMNNNSSDIESEKYVYNSEKELYDINIPIINKIGSPFWKDRAFFNETLEQSWKCITMLWYQDNRFYEGAQIIVDANSLEPLTIEGIEWYVRDLIQWGENPLFINATIDDLKSRDLRHIVINSKTFKPLKIKWIEWYIYSYSDFTAHGTQLAQANGNVIDPKTLEPLYIKDTDFTFSLDWGPYKINLSTSGLKIQIHDWSNTSAILNPATLELIEEEDIQESSIKTTINTWKERIKSMF